MKQRSLGSTEPMRPTEGNVFADTCDAEWLAREPGYENVMIWNIMCWKWDNISNERMPDLKICLVRLLRPLIPLAGKHAGSTLRFKRHADSANASEEVNKGEYATFHLNVNAE